MELHDFAERVLFASMIEGKVAGPEVDLEGRRATGLDPAFSAERSVDSQSQGRAPSVFCFNPFAEGHMAHGKNFTPKKSQAALAGDLANLPQFLCRQDDVVLLAKRPAIEFLSTVKEAGFPLPEFVELEAGSIPPASSLRQRKIGGLRPWAWGPESVALFDPLFPNWSGEARTGSQCFNAGIAELYSKAWSAALLKKVLSVWAGEPWLCTEREAGVAVSSVEAALEAIAAIRRRGHHRVVAKEAHGVAGHNAMRLWEPEVLESQRRWMAAAVAQGRQLVIEPWLERAADFSVQLEMGARELKLRGFTGLVNDSRGQFQANWAAANYGRDLPARVTAMFPAPPDVAVRIQRLYEDIRALLQDQLQRVGYVGPVGIDALVYQPTPGVFQLKPIVEINPRYTMGRLLVELMRQAAPGSCGLLRLVNRAMAKAEGLADFAAYARALDQRFPLSLEGAPTRTIRSGALCLNDPTHAQTCLAVFRVDRTPDGILTGNSPVP